MVKDIKIDNKIMTVVVLGEKSDVEINDYRETLMNMFTMASLWDSFSMCLREGEICTVLKIIQAFGLPEQEGGEV